MTKDLEDEKSPCNTKILILTVLSPREYCLLSVVFFGWVFKSIICVELLFCFVWSVPSYPIVCIPQIP